MATIYMQSTLIRMETLEGPSAFDFLIGSLAEQITTNEGVIYVKVMDSHELL